MNVSLLPVVLLACLSWPANASSNPRAATIPATPAIPTFAIAQPESLDRSTLVYPASKRRRWRAGGAPLRANETRQLRKLRKATDRLFAGEIHDYTLTRMPTSLDGVRSYDAIGWGSPNLAKVLSTTQYRTLKMVAVPVANESAEKERYMLSAGK